MSDLFLSHIRLYPIKGCSGTDVQMAAMDARGFRYDRRWMLINEYGLGLQQLDFPILARIVASLDDDCLCVQAPGMSPLRVPLQSPLLKPGIVRWYHGRCEAFSISEQADAWFQQFLHVWCRLVFMPENTPRFVAPEYALDHELAAFTSFQYHLLGEGSLEDLNQRLDTPVPLDRFRPNLVVSGAPPFAEDSWHTVRINHLTFHVVRPCDRCAITTVDAATGTKTDKEPLATLAKYRTFQQKVLFGQYLLSSESGMLHVGDTIEVLEYQNPTRSI
ncbi:MOSC domain-containing protein [Dictyobacter arantiisoli]|uniref:MOSC domain-containing protein n=1 Tax=Dictyobacter arantiisoli TaxID=2014874 RepID=A0A5A5TJJ6_9CHLR|nr:MOSC N-terminal beta barrel domain-containing protein [Dictyobacter arantiisoli]GCF11193.1 MOSC domain-containing protein [Dictyobacter arantiisoli]